MPKRTKPVVVQPETPGLALVSAVLAHASIKEAMFRRMHARAQEVVARLEYYIRDINGAIKRMQPDQESSFYTMIDHASALVRDIDGMGYNLHADTNLTCAAQFEKSRIEEMWARERFAAYTGDDKAQAQAQLDAFDTKREA